jgi:hypothetical protein
VRDGRTAPVERDGWLAKLAAGTGAEAVLAALQPGLVPVAPLGNDGNGPTEQLSEDERLYASLYGPEKKETVNG